VDNASTDGTAALVERIRPNMPTLRYVFEGSLGLSRARNAAISEASGAYIAFLDDDAVATSQWLEAILTAFDTIQPTPACVGGRIEPIWEGPRPSWLADALLGYLTIVNWSDSAMTLDPSRHYVAGANMAFELEALRRLGGFSPSLGRVGNKLLSAEELHVQRLLVAAGHQLHYEPRASVGHHVPASRLSQKWFLNRAYSEGLSTAVMRTVMEDLPRHRRAQMALHSSIALLCHPQDWAGAFLRANEADRFASLCRTVRRAGLIWGLLAFSGGARVIGGPAR
jgi:glycosyltransferase involved in cell wall biosynthesis